jgi:hypothetical protein
MCVCVCMCVYVYVYVCVCVCVFVWDSEYVGQRMAWILGFQKNYSKITPINIFGRGRT